jgi:hypothetical protein
MGKLHLNGFENKYINHPLRIHDKAKNVKIINLNIKDFHNSQIDFLIVNYPVQIYLQF